MLHTVSQMFTVMPMVLLRPNPTTASVLGNQPVNGNPDSCACSRVTEIFNKYQAVQADYSSFSDYLQQAYNTTVSQTVLDSLRQKCATTGTTTVCTGSTVSLSLPPLFQCNSGDVCLPASSISRIIITLLPHIPALFL